MHHLLEVAHAFSFYKHLPKSYWSLVVLIAYYLVNRIRSSVLVGQVPHRVLFPNCLLYHLPPRVFGCIFYVHALDPSRDKLDLWAIKCVFLGYSRA